MEATDLADEVLYRYADEGGNYSNGFFKAIENTLRIQQAEIETWKRKYNDMHNLATQAMSRVHELEKGPTWGPGKDMYGSY